MTRTNNPNKRRLTPAKLAERRQQLVDMRAAGHTWQHIADTLGYASKGAACKDLGIALDERKKELALSLDHYREQQLANLQALREVACEVMRKKHLVIQQGKIISHDDDGNPVYDDGPVLAAIDRIARIDAQIAQLLGLNSPAKLDAGGELRITLHGVDTTKLS